MSTTSDQRSQHHSSQHQVGITRRDGATLCSGESEPAVQNRSACDNTDAGMIIPAGLKLSGIRPRQRVRRRVEKGKKEAGAPRAAGARRQPRLTNPHLQDGDTYDRKAASVIMPPRSNENAPIVNTGLSAEAELGAAGTSVASTALRETVGQKSVATAVGHAAESREQVSARICEIGYRSVHNAGEVSAAAWQPALQVRSRHGTCASVLLQQDNPGRCSSLHMLLAF